MNHEQDGEVNAWHLLYSSCCILLNAFFAASEIALISLNDNRIAAMAEDGNKKAKLLAGACCANRAGSSRRSRSASRWPVSSRALSPRESFADDLAALAANAGVPVPREVLHTIALVVITLVLSYFTLCSGNWCRSGWR